MMIKCQSPRMNEIFILPFGELDLMRMNSFDGTVSTECSCANNEYQLRLLSKMCVVFSAVTVSSYRI
jgi:hypothetical protein